MPMSPTYGPLTPDHMIKIMNPLLPKYFLPCPNTIYKYTKHDKHYTKKKRKKERESVCGHTVHILCVQSQTDTWIESVYKLDNIGISIAIR